MMISTGDPGIDEVISGLRIGDNVVWQVNSVDDYRSIVVPFAQMALNNKRRVVYIRFGNHTPLLRDSEVSKKYILDAALGFESFSVDIHHILEEEGREVFYIFDCLSDLLSAWSNDLMIGNFFKITCPYLFDIDTIAYFSLLRYNHSFTTLARIRDTTQVLIDVFRYDENYYIHPLKVWNRYSPRMFLPHIRQNDKYIPIASSYDTARLFSNVFEKQTQNTQRKLDNWDRFFLKAEELSEQKDISVKESDKLFDHIVRLIISRDEKMVSLAKKNMSLKDLLAIKARIIGTGFIGGKTVGMLIARSIVLNDESIKAEQYFEPHDSFYVGSDVFYTYIVENGWWKEWLEQRSEKGYLSVARGLYQKLLCGKFPEEIKEQFERVLDYFGQSPIIVRSSSLLEDGFGNVFAGKYESVFLVNQGTPDERYAKFVDAVRTVYASTMSEEAVVYRLKRGLSALDEQMALLIQRVSGSFRNEYYFPDFAGVGISYNAFVWNKELDPQAGMLRLVLGLGTRAVNRVEGDYPRIVALDAPLLKAHADRSDSQKFSQHEVDVININENTLQTVSLNELISKTSDIPLDLIATKDYEGTVFLRQMGRNYDAWVLTFDPLFPRTGFDKIMRKILKTLEKEYGYPVDTEFTVNFRKDGKFQLNLLQCRPMMTRAMGDRVLIPQSLPQENIIFRSNGNFMGGNISLSIDRIIYVDPKAYCEMLAQSDKYDIARAVGEINNSVGDRERMSVMLLGPGRWGTSTPSLGVPVSFAEINNISVLGEIAFSDSNVMPELSYGSHFFQDLVESEIFYLALYPENQDGYYNRKFFDSGSEVLAKEFPHYDKYANVIKIFDLREKNIRLAADIITQTLICYEATAR